MTIHCLNSGFFFGINRDFGTSYYVGKPQDNDGNILIVGGTGSGKSSGIAKPSLKMWRGPIIAVDVKGELTHFYENIKSSKRPVKILRLIGEEGTFFSYDPFYFLRKNGKKNLAQNARELALAIIPSNNGDSQPFWIQSAQNVLTAAIIHFFDIGVDFIESMILIQTTPFKNLVADIISSKNQVAIMYISQFLDIEDYTGNKMVEGVRAELCSKVMLFASDEQIINALTLSENSITWEDIETHNIFIAVDKCKLEQWDRAVSLMITQLIRSLERRSDKYSTQDQNSSIMLLLDEFPRLGKIDVIKNGVATLRSKGVTICLMIQSLAQLDDIYGVNARRIIVDNCQYKAILNISDVESQKYFSEIAGITKAASKGMSIHRDPYNGKITESFQINESYEPVIYPHEFGMLDEDIVLITPSGCCRVKKLKYLRNTAL